MDVFRYFSFHSHKQKKEKYTIWYIYYIQTLVGGKVYYQSQFCSCSRDGRRDEREIVTNKKHIMSTHEVTQRTFDVFHAARIFPIFFSLRSHNHFSFLFCVRSLLSSRAHSPIHSHISTTDNNKHFFSSKSLFLNTIFSTIYIHDAA